MKPHPKIRKTIKWGGAVVTVLLVVVWFGSGRAGVRWMSRGGCSLGINSGGLFSVISTGEISMPDKDCGWLFPNRHGYWMDWDFAYYHSPSSPRVYLVRVPFWPFGTVVLPLTLIAWRLDTLARRRDRLNLCPRCNYDRTGLAAGAVCPECGAVLAIEV